MCLCMCANDSFYVAYIASVPGIVFITLSVCFCSLQIVDIYCYSGVYNFLMYGLKNLFW